MDIEGPIKDVIGTIRYNFLSKGMSASSKQPPSGFDRPSSKDDWIAFSLHRLDEENDRDEGSARAPEDDR